MAMADIAKRIAQLDWNSIRTNLDTGGCATTGAVLAPAECARLAESYDTDALFRSRVVMARHGFGSGDTSTSPTNCPSRWRRCARHSIRGWRRSRTDGRWRWGARPRIPPSTPPIIERCHAAGQTRPTPLLLRYGEGDYNCLHQDLYGDLFFPLQVAFLLSAPSQDFTGGEFVLTEQRPRMQSRAEVVSLVQGEGVIFAVNQRPVRGSRGAYRVTMRHGVSRLRSGHRLTLGVIFHDAK